jgi:hypothetical protein
MSATNGAKCSAAQYEVLRNAAAHPSASGREAVIAERLWEVAGVSAAYLDWRTADEAAMLALQLAGTKPHGVSRMFSALCRISPKLALRFREMGMRFARPASRNGYPKFHLGFRPR